MPDTLYMLDTNIASYLIKEKSEILKDHIRKAPIVNLCISSITEAELLRGLAKIPEAKKLPALVKEFLLRVEILAWDSNAAQAYATLKTASEKTGKSLGTLDMLIASHAAAVKAVLVTNDQAFFQFEDYLHIEDWTKSSSNH